MHVTHYGGVDLRREDETITIFMWRHLSMGGGGFSTEMLKPTKQTLVSHTKMMMADGHSVCCDVCFAASGGQFEDSHHSNLD